VPYTHRHWSHTCVATRIDPHCIPQILARGGMSYMRGRVKVLYPLAARGWNITPVQHGEGYTHSFTQKVHSGAHKPLVTS